MFFSVLFLFLLLREKGCVPFQYVSVFLLMVIVFISNRAGEHEMCWYLYCGKSVCSDTQQSVSRKHLSHSLDCFNNSSIVSFALVQGIDPGSLCVIEFLCRC